MFTKNNIHRIRTFVVLLFAIALFFSVVAQADIDPNIDIRAYAKKADFIFKAKGLDFGGISHKIRKKLIYCNPMRILILL